MDTDKTPPAAPTSSPQGHKKRKAKIPTDSATGRELRKWHAYQRTVEVYNGVRRRYRLVQFVGDKITRVSRPICKIVIDTDLGCAVDDVLAIGVRQANMATMKISNPIPRIRESLDKTKRRITRGILRNFPPFVFVRWSVDLALAVACVFLALVRDIDRITDKQSDNRDYIYEFETPRVPVQLPVFEPGVINMYARFYCDDDDDNDLENADGSPNRPRDANSVQRDNVRPPTEPLPPPPHVIAQIALLDPVPPPRPEAIPQIVAPEVENPTVHVENKSCDHEKPVEDGDITTSDYRNLADYIESFKERHLYIAVFLGEICFWVNFLTNFAVILTIPWVMLVVYVLRLLSVKVNGISGGFDPETPEERKQRREMYIRLIGAVEHYTELGQLRSDEWLLDIVIDKHVVSLMKWPIIGRILGCFVSRPFHVFGTLATVIREMLYIRNEMVDYLKDDPDYDEDEDPDYQPNDGDIVEDSLEYKDDSELAPDAETDHDDTWPSNGRLNQTTPPRTVRSRRQTTRSQSSVGSNINPPETSARRKSTPAKTASMCGKSPRQARKSGVQASSTPKDNARTKDKQGTSTELTTKEATNSMLAFEEEDTIILAPLSPEKLKQIKTRDPIQAAVIRMKGDKIIEFKRKMREKKQEKKFKTKKKIIKNTTNGCEVIHEAEENKMSGREAGESLEMDPEKKGASPPYGACAYPNQEMETKCNQVDDRDNTSKQGARSDSLDGNAPDYTNVPEHATTHSVIATKSFQDADGKNMAAQGGMAAAAKSHDFPVVTVTEDVTGSSTETCEKSVSKSQKWNSQSDLLEEHTSDFRDEGNPRNGAISAIGTDDQDGGKDFTRYSENRAESDHSKGSIYVPRSPEISSTPHSPKVNEFLEAGDGMRSSSVDTGQTNIGW